MLHLPDLQRALFRVIVTADQDDTVSDGLTVLESEIQGDDRLGARERIAVYARMYGARLVDALTEDYPRVRATIGEERFHELARAYVAVYPSTHPSLRWFGARFADYLATTVALPGFLADLARLEWARIMVFDAPDADLLHVDFLRRLPAEAWADLRLHPIPALEVLQFAWPVHRIWEVAETGPPAEIDWPREEVWLRVWRQGDRVYQASLGVEERTALAHLRDGDDFAMLCGGLAAVGPAEHAATTAGGLVLRWIEDGLLVGDGPDS